MQVTVPMWKHFMVFIVTEQKEIITQCTLNFRCVHVWVHAYSGMCREVRRQFVGVGSFLLPCGLWGADSGHWVREQMYLLAQPPPGPTSRCFPHTRV